MSRKGVHITVCVEVFPEHVETEEDLLKLGRFVSEIAREKLIQDLTAKKK